MNSKQGKIELPRGKFTFVESDGPNGPWSPIPDEALDVTLSLTELKKTQRKAATLFFGQIMPIRSERQRMYRKAP